MTSGRFANIIIDISHEKVDRPFQYKVPESLRDKLKPGMCVVVPFGKGNTERYGYVIELTDKAEFAESGLKEIIRVSEKRMLAQDNQIRLAAWIKEHYGSTMITALKTVLPVKQTGRTPKRRQLFLALDENTGRELLKEYERKHYTARFRLLERLLKEGEKGLSYEQAVKEIKVSPAMLREAVQSGILRLKEEDAYRNPIKSILQQPGKEIVLSKEQKETACQILTDYEAGNNGVYLIHGITGSGKTEVYMELIAGMLEKKKQVIVLIPEISLTYQTVSRFYLRFGDRVSVIHSRLSKGERYDQWERAKNGEVDVMIGPRSALFTPFSNLGLVIIDEEHEQSYKSETMPKYHAREAAKELISYYGASLVLGSATPSLESYYEVQKGRIKKFELTKRLTGGQLPRIYIEDMREELRDGNRSVFSRRFRQMLSDRLEKGEQAMLFLNRRGYAGFVSCRSCGYVMKCPHCDVSLSEHKGGMLICHYCGYGRRKVSLCPECGSKYISGFRAGTQAVEDMLAKEFPKARVLRMDADTTRRKGSFEEILTAFAAGKADILIGTQMIVKGHDFPNVTLVGILAADLSLHTGDYRSAERTFQLLTQAAGRAGRGKIPGEVVIQTYQPEHHSIRFAAAQDYQGFYREETEYRKLMDYPPAAGLLAVLILSEEEDRGRKLAEKLAEHLKIKMGKLTIMGPAPASVGRINDKYRTVFYIKSRDENVLTEGKDILEQYLEENGEALLKAESVQFDFNPLSAY